jgi:hypothetical protein
VLCEYEPGLSSQNKQLLDGVWEKLHEKIFGQKRDIATGGWSELHNEELHKFVSSKHIHSEINQLVADGRDK